MISVECMLNRHTFLRGSAGMAVGLCAAPLLESAAAAENAWIMGPQPGFTPDIGTLTSMLAFTRMQVVITCEACRSRISTICSTPEATSGHGETVIACGRLVDV